MFHTFKKIKKAIFSKTCDADLDPDFLNRCLDDPQVLVEITSRCNFACTYCSSSFKERKKVDMSLELFEHIVGQLPEITKKAVRLHIDGEPTVHPEFYTMARLVNEHGLPVALASNGSLLDPRFLDLDMDLVITLSTSAEEFSERHRKLDFGHYVDRVVDYVKKWTQKETTQSLTIQIIFDNNERNNQAYTSAKEEFLKSFARRSNLSGIPSIEKGPSRIFTKSPREHLEFSRQYLATRGLYPEKGKRKPCEPVESGFCDSPWKRLAILADGRVSYCCIDLSGGTVFTEPGEILSTGIKELWLNHPRIRQVRDNFLSQSITDEVCKTCLSAAPGNRRCVGFKTGRHDSGAG